MQSFFIKIYQIKQNSAETPLNVSLCELWCDININLQIHLQFTSCSVALSNRFAVYLEFVHPFADI